MKDQTPEIRKREHRIQARELRVKRNQAGEPFIEGYAAVFNSLSEDLGGFREQILPGAFTQTLSNKADVRALFNHDANIVLGRTKSGTLTLNEDETGLFWSCQLPNTATARDLAISIERGDVDQCSFGFYCLDDSWELQNGTPLRSVRTAELFDVSAVTYPAYADTSIAMRSLWRDGQPESIQEALQALSNSEAENRAAAEPKTCQCVDCVEQKCSECSIPGSDAPVCGCSALRLAMARLRLAESSL